MYKHVVSIKLINLSELYIRVSLRIVYAGLPRTKKKYDVFRSEKSKGI